MRLWQRPRRGLGIDITPGAVKLMELTQRKGQRLESRAAEVPLPSGAADSQRLRQMDDVVQALTQALATAKPTARRATVSVPTQATLIKTLELPATLSESAVESRIAAESDRHIPLPFSRVAWDFCRLGPVPGDEQAQRVMLVVCRQQWINQLSELLARVELVPLAVETEATALARWAQRRQPGPDMADAEFAVLHLDSRRASLHVVASRHVLFSRSMPRSAPESQAALSRVDELVRWIERSLRSVYSTIHTPQLRHLFITGQGSDTPTLAAYLADKTGLETHTAHDLPGDEPSTSGDAAAALPGFTLACGLALRALA